MIESEASYNQMNRDEANVKMHDALDRLAERLTLIEHTVSVDTALRHSEDFEALRADIQVVRIAGDTLSR